MQDIRPKSYPELSTEEHEMLLRGNDRYGAYFRNAVELSNLLDNFIESVKKPERYLVVLFLSQVRKHQTLALFSAVRRHHNQMGMNLRQVLESGCWLVYAMEHDDVARFCEKGGDGTTVVSDRLRNSMYGWVAKNYPDKSSQVKKLKKLINDSVAHANVIYGFQNFELLDSEKKGFYLTYFDKDDDFKVKTDLWSVANIAMGLMDFFYEANKKYEVFEFSDTFKSRFTELIQENNRLKEESMQHERYKAVQKRVESKGS